MNISTTMQCEGKSEAIGVLRTAGSATDAPFGSAGTSFSSGWLRMLCGVSGGANGAPIEGGRTEGGELAAGEGSTADAVNGQASRTSGKEQTTILHGGKTSEARKSAKDAGAEESAPERGAGPAKSAETAAARANRLRDTCRLETGGGAATRHRARTGAMSGEVRRSGGTPYAAEPGNGAIAICCAPAANAAAPSDALPEKRAAKGVQEMRGHGRSQPGFGAVQDGGDAEGIMSAGTGPERDAAPTQPAGGREISAAHDDEPADGPGPDEREGRVTSLTSASEAGNMPGEMRAPRLDSSISFELAPRGAEDARASAAAEALPVAGSKDPGAMETHGVRTASWSGGRRGVEPGSLDAQQHRTDGPGKQPLAGKRETSGAEMRTMSAHIAGAGAESAGWVRDAAGARGTADPAAISGSAWSGGEADARGEPLREPWVAADAGMEWKAPNWVRAGPRHAEAGFEDPVLGWVGVRADWSGSGIHASIVPATTEAAQVLGDHMRGLNDYLTEQRTPVAGIALEHAGGEAGMGTGQAPQHQEEKNTEPGGSNQMPPTSPTEIGSRRVEEWEAQTSQGGMAVPIDAGGSRGMHISVMA